MMLICVRTCNEQKSTYPPSYIALAFWNGLEYRNADGNINSGTDASTSCKNLESFGLVVWSLRGLTVHSRRKLAISSLGGSTLRH